MVFAFALAAAPTHAMINDTKTSHRVCSSSFDPNLLNIIATYLTPEELATLSSARRSAKQMMAFVAQRVTQVKLTKGKSVIDALTLFLRNQDGTWNLTNTKLSFIDTSNVNLTEEEIDFITH